MLGLMRLRAQLIYPHMFVKRRHFDVGEGDYSCLSYLPHTSKTSRDQWVITSLAWRWPLALRVPWEMIAGIPGGLSNGT